MTKSWSVRSLVAVVLAVAVAVLATPAPAHAMKKPLTDEQIQEIVAQVQGEINELIADVQADSLELLNDLTEIGNELLLDPEADPAKIQKLVSKIQKSVGKTALKVSKKIEKTSLKAAKKLGAGGAEQEIIDQINQARAEALSNLDGAFAEIQEALGGLSIPSFPQF